MSHETIENIAGAAAGLAVAVGMTLLFVAMSAPVIETARKFIS